MPNAINLRALYGQLEVGLNQRVQDFAAELIEQEFRRFIAGLVKRATLDLEEQYTADIDRAINQAIHDELSKLAEKYK